MSLFILCSFCHVWRTDFNKTFVSRVLRCGWFEIIASYCIVYDWQRRLWCGLLSGTMMTCQLQLYWRISTPRNTRLSSTAMWCTHVSVLICQRRPTSIRASHTRPALDTRSYYVRRVRRHFIVLRHRLTRSSVSSVIMNSIACSEPIGYLTHLHCTQIPAIDSITVTTDRHGPVQRSCDFLQ